MKKRSNNKYNNIIIKENIKDTLSPKPSKNIAVEYTRCDIRVTP